MATLSSTTSTDLTPVITPSSSSSSTTSTSSTPSSSTIPPSSSSTIPSTTSIPSTSSVPSISSTPLTTSTPPTSSQQVSTRSDGGLVTLTLTQTSAPTQSSTTGGGGDTSFFDNKAEVAAVFSVAGIIGLVLVFLLITTCIRRRRARKFDRDVAEAAAAAAAASADPFFEDEEERGGAHWDPRRGSTAHGGGAYGKLNEDPYAYAAGGVAGGAGFARHGTQYSQSRSQRDQYGMNDLGSSGHPSSAYTHSTGYTPAANSYYAEQPQMDYGRPSFGSNAPGIAGVGSGGGPIPGPQQYGQEKQNLRYRGGQQQNNFNGVEDAYGGYTTAAAIPSDADRYPNPYASPSTSTAYSQNPVRRSTNYSSPPLPPVPMPNSPPRSPRSPPPPPSYSGHGHGPGQSSQGELLQSGRPISVNPKGAPMPPPNMPLPPPPGPVPGPGTPEESWNDRQGILRVANE